MHEVPLCRKTCLLAYILLCRHHCHASFPNNVAARMMQQQPIWCEGCRAHGFDANEDAHCHLVGNLLPIAWYKILRIPTLITTQTNPQHPSTHRDLNGHQHPPWCPTPGVNADNSFPECWWIVVCGGVGSGAPWQPWEDGGHHGCGGRI